MVDMTKNLERQLQFIPSASNNAASTPWIEKVLTDSPIDDYRKLTIALILSRYLINVKKLGYEQAYAIIWEWLDKCQEFKRLEPSRQHLAVAAFSTCISTSKRELHS